MEVITMSNAKQLMVEIIARQPDDSTYDALLRELAYARMIQRGLRDSEAGNVISQEEAINRAKTWQR
jgi:predicted transcriptional regulator